MSSTPNNPLQREKKEANVDDRHWDETVPLRANSLPKDVQRCYTHSQYEVRDAACWRSDCLRALHCHTNSAHVLSRMTPYNTWNHPHWCVWLNFDDDIHDTQTHYLTMRDGVRIAADVLRPPTGQFDESRGLPCVLLQTRCSLDLLALLLCKQAGRHAGLLQHAFFGRPDEVLCDCTGTSAAQCRGGRFGSC